MQLLHLEDKCLVLLLNLEALFCTSAGIPCEPPPDIPNGKHTGRLLDEFHFGTSVTYTCDPGYPLHGEPSIYCTSRDGKNGVWSGPPPRCGGRAGCVGANTGVQSSHPTASHLERLGNLQTVAPRARVPVCRGCLYQPTASSIPSPTFQLGSLPSTLDIIGCGQCVIYGKIIFRLAS